MGAEPAVEAGDMHCRSDGCASEARFQRDRPQRRTKLMNTNSNPIAGSGHVRPGRRLKIARVGDVRAALKEIIHHG